MSAPRQAEPFRLLVLTQYFDPEPIPKPGALAGELRARGHRVTVVTGFPHYPGSSVYSGYALAPFRREQRGGVEVVRGYLWPYHGKSALGRILNYGSFMLSAPFAALLASEADVVYVWHPPLTVGIAAWLIARWRGIPFVYDVQDVWPESVEASGFVRRRWVLRLLEAVERFVYAQADHILVVTDGAKANLVAKGVDEARLTVTPGWVEDAEFEPVSAVRREAARHELGGDGTFVVLFTGNLGVVQDLGTLVLAARELRGTGVRIALAGDGSDRERLEALARSVECADALVFLGRRPRDEMPALMAAADALVVTLKASTLAEFVVPSKTYAYLAAARPVLSATGGAADRLVSGVGAGLAVPPEDPKALAGAIRTLKGLAPAERDAMGARGRAYARENLTRRAVVDLHERVLDAAAKASH
ncbi:MAG: glycosyltransferase family 4 protein [Acidobacteria bacterium]|nr:glycosyltransferase family 4 protein [Acidobacteriota bacterium]